MMSGRTGVTRCVVFHADDFGMNNVVNCGILKALREGLLTSTSVLANAPDAEYACQQWPELADDYAHAKLPSCENRLRLELHPAPFDLGIHLNLTQGFPLTGSKYPRELLDERGSFPGIATLFYRLHRATSPQLQLVKNELQAQVEWMIDRHLQPTHLNGHQYLELIPQISGMIPNLMNRYSISTVRLALESCLVRNVLLRGDFAGWGLSLVKASFARSFRRRLRRYDFRFPDRFFGTSHAGRIDRRLLLRFLDQSQNEELTEFGLHPAEDAVTEQFAPGNPWFDPLSKLRPIELKWLCNADLPEILAKRGRTLGRLGLGH